MVRMRLTVNDFVSLDSLESGFREKLLEYVFLSELLQESWLRRHHKAIDVLRPDVDRSGYDLALECEGVTRYVQLKSSRLDAKTSRQTLNKDLAEKMGGCVIWIQYEVIGGRFNLKYRFFGDAPTQKPNLGNRVGKHSKANAAGFKAERPDTRVLNKGDFTVMAGIGELVDRLFP